MSSRIEIFFPVKDEVIHTVIDRGVLFALPGPQGVGIPAGGASGQMLRKVGASDYVLEWFTPADSGITNTDVANWNAAYSWGNHSAAGYLTAAVAASSYQPLSAGLSALAGLSGTGFVKKTGANTYAVDTNTYLTAESDPIFSASAAFGITNTDKANWNTAFGWGNHASAGYLTTSSAATLYQPKDTDLTQIAALSTTGLLRRSGIGTWSLDATSYLSAEIDPVFTASAAAGITGTNITNWNTAFGWGNHASAGYVTTAGARTAISLTTTGTSGAATYNSTTGVLNIPQYSGGGGGGSETDPVFTASAAFGITGTNITNWNTAFGWGNHASAGYLTTSSAASTYQPLDGDLTSIAGLAGTSGLLKKTAANTWTLDTTAYVDQAGARSAISLTTTGTTGSATYNSSTGVLNIPNYSAGSALASGVAGAVQFSDGTNLSSDANNFKWDNTNKQLGLNLVGFGSSATLHARGSGLTASTFSFKTQNSNGTKYAFFDDAGQLGINVSASASLHVRGAGLTSSTVSFKTENSAGTHYFQFLDNGSAQIAMPGATSGFSALSATFYSFRSPNGGSYINVDGGLMAFYDSNGALGINMTANETRIVKPVKIGANTAPDASAILDAESTTKGFLPPRMTTTQRNAIATPAEGLVLYNTTSGALTVRLASSWLEVGASGGVGTETDPVFTASAAFGITGTNITNWNTAFGWGNHASAGYATTSAVAAGYQPLDGDLTSIAGLAGTSGMLRKTAANTWTLDTNTYLTSYTETDPVFTASAAFDITGTNITNWNTAFGWGNHASAGYVTTAGARSAISLTTTGTSGAATYNSSTGALNIPNYATGGGGGVTVTEVTGTSQAISVNNGYIANNASQVVFSLPTTCAVGDRFFVKGKGAGGWKISQAAGQQIIWDEGAVNGTNQTTSGTGGFLQSTDDYDFIELVCLVANTTFSPMGVKGNISIT